MNSFQIFNAMDQVAIDCLGPITQTLSGKRHVIVSIDMFTRFIDAEALSDISAQTFAEYFSKYCGRFGFPKTLLTDNSSTFTSNLVRELYRVFGVKRIRSTPYHSRGNAVVERAIETLQEKLSVSLNDVVESQWDLVLPAAVLAMNTSTHAATGYSPFELVFGRKNESNSALVDTSYRPEDIQAELIRRRLDEYRGEAITRNSDSQVNSRNRFEARHRDTDFEIGESVVVKASDRRSKLSNRYKDDVFEIIGRQNDIYQLRDTRGRIISRHISKLKAYRRRDNQIIEEEIPEMCDRKKDQVNSESEDEILQPTNMVRKKSSKSGINRPNFVEFVLTILLMNIVSPSTSIVFDRVAPVVYVRTNHFVDDGLVNYSMEIHFDNPCPLLEKFSQAKDEEAIPAIEHCNKIYNAFIQGGSKSMSRTSKRETLRWEILTSCRERNVK